MQFKRLLFSINRYLNKFFHKYIVMRKGSIINSEQKIKFNLREHQIKSWPQVNSVTPSGFKLNFYFTNSFFVDKKKYFSQSFDSSPRYFYINSNKALKIPNVNDNNIVYTYWLLWVICYGTLFCVNAALIATNISAFEYGNRQMGAAFDLALVSFAAMLSICFLDAVAVSQIIPVPYIIFDDEIKSVVLRGQGPDEVIPFHLVSFSVLQIEDSPAYCALEMHIAYTDKPDKKMITDICESQPQAQSILKTYLSILAGDKEIYRMKLKRHPALLSEFNMPWWKGLMHFWRTSTDWYSCVFTHYIAFRWVHGHPMGVLKKYIIEQELKKPLKIK